MTWRSGSVAAHRIHDTGNWPAALHRLDLASNLCNGFIPQGARCGMRSHRDLGMLPERMLRRQRLSAKDIERGTRELPTVNQRQQVIVHQMGAARHVDDVAAALQLR